MFKVSNKLLSIIVNFEHISQLFSSVSIVNFEQANVSWVSFGSDLSNVKIFYSLIHCKKDDGADDVELHIICKIPADFKALKSEVSLRDIERQKQVAKLTLVRKETLRSNLKTSDWLMQN